MLKAKNIGLVGFGREGQSSLKFIQSLKGKRKVSVVDAKDGPDYLKGLKEYDLIIRSPGVPFKLVKKHAAPAAVITSQTKLFFDLCPAKIIGVTGTKGKSTTASVIAAVLKPKFTTHLVGNIGRPPLGDLAKIKADDMVVFELSSHQLSDLEKSPPVAVLLNLFPEHLDYYADFSEYAQAKARITQFQTKKDLLIYNREDQAIVKIANQSRARKITFSSVAHSEADCQVKGDYIYYQGRPIFPVAKTSLQGKFNLANIMPAVILGNEMEVNQKLIVQAIANFHSLPHRLERVGRFAGITYINDSLSTVPEAAIEAIKALKGSLGSLIVGGYDRGVNQSKLVATIIKNKVPAVIVLPETGTKIAKMIKGKQARGVKIYEAADMRQAVTLAKSHTGKGKVCLMSPAAASFNLFSDYQDRGEQFKLWVKKL